MSEEIERKVLKLLPREFNSIKSWVMCALPKLDEFFLNPQVRVQSETVPATSRNMKLDNHETTGDHSQNDHRPEVDSLPVYSIHGFRPKRDILQPRNQTDVSISKILISVKKQVDSQYNFVKLC